MMIKAMYSTLAVLLSSSVGLVGANNGGPLATCPLVNHPDGAHNPPGEVLYGLIMTEFDGEDRIMFDFNYDGAGMKLAVYENRLRIFGRAMGRVLIDGVWEPTNLWRINFLYRNTIEVDDGGIPDIQVLGSDNSDGSFVNLASGESFDVSNKADDEGISFLLGDSTGHGYRLTEAELDELSSGGDLAIEGAGWINVGDEGEGHYPHPRDFLFVALGC